jgi:hypothetical protein
MRCMLDLKDFIAIDATPDSNQVSIKVSDLLAVYVRKFDRFIPPLNLPGYLLIKNFQDPNIGANGFYLPTPDLSKRALCN